MKDTVITAGGRLTMLKGMDDDPKWKSPQFTEAIAKIFFDRQLYRNLNKQERAVLQINQERLCMPFDVFVDAVSDTVGHPVFDIQLAMGYTKIKAEIETKAKTTFEEVMGHYTTLTKRG